MISYHRVFFNANGPLPHPCGKCGKPVTSVKRYEGVIHHIDEDRSNNDASNLVPMHFGCHMAHHKIGKTPPPLSEEGKQRIRDAMTNRFVRAETRAKIGAAKKGSKHTEEARAKMRAAHVTRDSSTKIGHLMSECECGLIRNVGTMAQHCKKTGHVARRIQNA